MEADLNPEDLSRRALVRILERVRHITYANVTDAEKTNEIHEVLASHGIREPESIEE